MRARVFLYIFACLAVSVQVNAQSKYDKAKNTHLWNDGPLGWDIISVDPNAVPGNAHIPFIISSSKNRIKRDGVFYEYETYTAALPKNKAWVSLDLKTPASLESLQAEFDLLECLAREMRDSVNTGKMTDVDARSIAIQKFEEIKAECAAKGILPSRHPGIDNFDITAIKWKESNRLSIISLSPTLSIPIGCISDLTACSGGLDAQLTSMKRKNGLLFDIGMSFSRIRSKYGRVDGDELRYPQMVLTNASAGACRSLFQDSKWRCVASASAGLSYRRTYSYKIFGPMLKESVSADYLIHNTISILNNRPQKNTFGICFGISSDQVWCQHAGFFLPSINLFAGITLHTRALQCQD